MMEKVMGLIAKRALPVLREQPVMPRLVNRDYANDV
jgi:hypothetical protein